MGSEDHQYFLQLEEAFLRLRGAPLVLSPADWKLAREWRQLGIPADFVIGVFEEVFKLRAERDSDRRVNGLRYCASAVTKAWRHQAELLGPPDLRSAEDSEVPEPRVRLESLALRLPREWSGTATIESRLLAMDGGLAEIEASLTRLDQEMLELAWSTLDVESRRQIEVEVAARGAQFGSGSLDLGSRLRSQVLRKRLALPRLSLFALAD